jgi:hypothetical protein
MGGAGSQEPDMRTKRPHPQDMAEARQIAGAVYFTACRRIDRATYDTRRAATLAEAEAIAETMGRNRTMVYAVTPEGYTVAVTERNKAALASVATH